MANNRMYLLHPPSGKAVYIAKRMGFGWYRNRSAESLWRDIMRLFKTLQNDFPGFAITQDDFAIAMESTDGTTPVITSWKFGKPSAVKGVENFVLDATREDK